MDYSNIIGGGIEKMCLKRAGIEMKWVMTLFYNWDVFTKESLLGEYNGL